MRKPGTDSNWNLLTVPQREMVEKWLLTEHLGFEETVARVKAEFGLETSVASVGRMLDRAVETPAQSK